MRFRLARRLARFEAFAETRRGALVLFVLALAVFWFQRIAMPVAGGRDFGSYVWAATILVAAALPRAARRSRGRLS